MKTSKFSLLFFITLVFLLPSIVLANSNQQILLNLDLLDQPEILGQWQVFNQGGEEALFKEDNGFLLKSNGDAYLAYPIIFSYKDFDGLVISLQTDKEVKMTVIANISTTGLNTFEFEQEVQPGADFKEYYFSLRHPFFKEVEDFGINFYSDEPANIIIKEIRLYKKSFSQTIAQIFKDYFHVASYSPFTVNVFPAPRIFGHSAFVYFMPIFLILVWFLLFSQKHRKKVLFGLLVLWLVIDLRMGYEFFNYQKTDYQTWVKPPRKEKIFRNYDDLYVFIDWLDNNLPVEVAVINYYFLGAVQFPRILQYYLYPIEVYHEGNQSTTYVVFRQSDITYNSEDNKLYQEEKPISQAGEIVASYDNNSFIFVEK